METIIDVAKYISKRYFEEKEEEIDEIKLHKITFFIQKESFLRNDKEMFKEDFVGWKHGPVCKIVRKNFKEIKKNRVLINLDEKNKKIIDFIFEKYKDMDSYKLSYLTHLEYSWIKSRLGIENGKTKERIIPKADIKFDAVKIS